MELRLDPLIYLICLIFVALATLCAAGTPKWQAPDEPAHFDHNRASAV
jgi:hypothetical protein